MNHHLLTGDFPAPDRVVSGHKRTLACGDADNLRILLQGRCELLEAIGADQPPRIRLESQHPFVVESQVEAAHIALLQEHKG